MTTSSSNNYNSTRDNIVYRAWRIVHAMGLEENEDTYAMATAVQALNDLIAEWNVDGMPQWNLRNYTVTLVASTGSYTIGTGSTTNVPAPLKIIQAWLNDTASGADTPVNLITRDEYNRYSNKTSTGTPNQLFYQIPLAIQASGESQGTIYVLPPPDATCAAAKTLVVVGQKPFDDFDAAGNTLDLPPYWINALIWGLADQLSYEFGLGLAERSMISKKAEKHKEAALSFGTEEGSMYLQPAANWDNQ